MIILVTGGTGLVGNAIREISKDSQHNYIFLSSQDCDLTDYSSTLNLFEKIKPDYIIHLAACVGGLYKNMNKKIELYEKNIIMNTNIVRIAYIINVKKLICCLSTCIFPDKTTYPIDETMLHNGAPHSSNYGYAYAKRMLEIQCRSYNEQNNTNYICIIPTNIYGKYDNFNLEDSHVIPGLIHKCYLAKKENKPFIINGDGTPLRQFIYADDLAKLIIWSLDHYNEREPIILAPDEKDEISIGDIGIMIAKEFNVDNIEFDNTKSNGQYKKTANNLKLRKYLPNFKFTEINEGIKASVKWFINNYDICRK